MFRLPVFIILTLVLLTGCASPGETALPTPLETVVPTLDFEEETAAVMEPGPMSTAAVTDTAAPSPTAEPVASPIAEEDLPAGWVAYVGQDGNLWLVDPADGEGRQLTQDAVLMQPGETPERKITYANPKWSSDGKLLAFTQEVGTRIETGYSIAINLSVYDLEAGAARTVATEDSIAGFDWKPGTHLIAYGLPVSQDYFLKQDPTSARGIWSVDVDRGESAELVPPDRGRPLVGPTWSRDGRFLAFDEVLYLEGRGKFSYYDFEAQDYVPWEQVIGSYTWSPDGEYIAYDRLSYIPQGTERIWLSDRQGQAEQALSPDYEPGYAYNPVFSPQGDQVAYLAELGELENSEYHLFVVEVSGGEPSDLGVFEQPFGLAWSPNGDQLILTTGQFGEQQITAVHVSSGETRSLAAGSQPSWQP